MESNVILRIFSFFFVFALIYIIGKIIFKDGLRPLFYGAKIDEKIGEINSNTKSIFKGGVIVDLLSKKNGVKKVGITVVIKSLTGISMLSVSLSKDEAQELLKYLKEAIDKS
jgi:hypothetical protein